VIDFTDDDYKEMKEKFEELSEKYLDEIFGYESKLDRKEWKKKVI